MNSASLSFPDPQEAEYTFAGLRLKPDGTLLRGGRQIHLAPKELAALRVLLDHAGQIVTSAQLKQALWPGVYVSADSVPRCLSSLRAALLPDECIQTVYKQGYRFTKPVLRRPAAPPEANNPRLAILPFACNAQTIDHLGAAVAEETIVSLNHAYSGRRMSYTILARDSVFTLAQQGRSARQIGQALNADLVLTGSLSEVINHYRLRAEMIRVEDDVQLWVEDFLVPRQRIAGLESTLARRLADRLELGASGLNLSAAAASSGNGDISPTRREAYEKYLHGHQDLWSLRRFRMQDGLQNLLRATELDPTLVQAQLDLIHLCVAQSFCGFLSPAVAAEQVRRAARAIPRGSDEATAVLPSMGWVRFHLDRNLDAALHAFDDSAHLPHDPWTTRARTAFAASRGRYKETIGLLESALVEDPYAPWLHSRLAWVWHLARQPGKSVDQIERALALFGEHESCCLYGTMILACNGRTERALSLAESLVRIAPYCDLATAVQGYALAMAGHPEEAAAIVERLQWLSRERYVLASFTPAICVALGDTESAVNELHAAEEAHCPWFFQMLADPRLDPLHDHPDFRQMQEILPGMEAAAARKRAAREPSLMLVEEKSGK